ncbi:cysteine hydrolase family protein [Agromyces soli]|uniref:Isochorismatase family protein n=1 Tax=Agromyces soli TaxID=659012 RepID=A0ABY4B158_9MICO|nr:isochorismatase family protein [Agromyces soli]UOE26760.1 isochorismatase family protein [Agromyces soli]
MTARSDTALLVIDVQESFRQRADDWAATANPRAVPNVVRLVERAREAGDLIVWVTHAEPGTGHVFDPALGFVRVMDELQPGADEPRVTKTSINAFTSTNLQQQLTVAGIRRLVVCGIRAEQCCETTARVASDLGYEVQFVIDATTTSPIRAGEGYQEISGEQLMARTASILGGRGFAEIVTTEQLAGVAVPA